MPHAHPLKNATFRQLATFHAVARLGSVSRAAEEMHLTQPAVSIQLGILEDAAGTPLLHRSARGVKLTEAGELLAAYAARILELWRETGEAMALHCGEVAGLLRVGAVTTAEYLLPPLLLEFVHEHPQVKVKLQVGNRAETVNQLANQDIDLAVMGRAPAELKASSVAFARHPMAFVAAPTHPLMH
jgi:LysR family transcriptional regulator, low CO2-responsive transcriptional regulator